MGVVTDGVTGRRRLQPIRLKDGLLELGNGPDLDSEGSEPLSTIPNRILGPALEGAESLIHAEGALAEASLRIPLLGERSVTELGVVTGKRQVADGVQIALLYPRPVGPQVALPLRRQALVLGEDVLDRVLVHRHALLAVVIFEPPEPVT